MLIKYDSDIEYYDQPLLFLAFDADLTQFICVLVEEHSDYDVYLCVRISHRRLQNFMKEGTGLHSIYETPETAEWYCVKTDNLTIGMDAQPIERDDIPADWFPGD